ncbi:MAG TPA: metallophosphoesterase family protein, partial [bacterium]|nr:metallophosphoesterase family protein [bacterium]
MKVVVLSDTHLPAFGVRLPDEAIRAIGESDLILHSGDIVQKSFLDELSGRKEVRAVLGNMDMEPLASLLPETRIEELEGVRIGMTHGFGAPQGIEQRVQTRFRKEDNLDVLIFGHSHVPMQRMQGNLLLLNPGSATDRVY